MSLRNQPVPVADTSGFHTTAFAVTTGVVNLAEVGVGIGTALATSRFLGARTVLFGMDKALRTASEGYKGTTRLGHALSKHAGRNPALWGKVGGNPSTWHEQAVRHFDEIVKGPGEFQRITNGQGTAFLEKMLPDGRGLRLQLDYTFKGFIE